MRVFGDASYHRRAMRAGSGDENRDLRKNSCCGVRRCVAAANTAPADAIPTFLNGLKRHPLVARLVVCVDPRYPTPNPGRIPNVANPAAALLRPAAVRAAAVRPVAATTIVRREAAVKRMYLLAAAKADVRLFALKNYMVPEWVHWVHSDNDSGDLSLYYPLRMPSYLDHEQHYLSRSGLPALTALAGQRQKWRSPRNRAQSPV